MTVLCSTYTKVTMQNLMLIRVHVHVHCNGHSQGASAADFAVHSIELAGSRLGPVNYMTLYRVTVLFLPTSSHVPDLTVLRLVVASKKF